MTLSKDNGGVGLIDMAAKARALRVSYIQRLFKQSPITPEPVPNEIKMLSISDSINTILLYFLGFHMKNNLNVQFQHSFSQYSRRNLTEIRASSVILDQIYGDVVHYHNISRDKDMSTISSKSYYQLLIDKPNTFCDFGLYIIDREDIDDIWKNIFIKNSDNVVIALNYKIIYGQTRTQSLKYKENNLFHNPLVLTRNAWCFYCTNHLNISNQVETLQHIFIDCPIAFHTWEIIKARLSQAGLNVYGHKVENDTFKIDPLKILFKIKSSLPESFFINEVNYILWNNRCENFNTLNYHGGDVVIHRLISRLQMLSEIQRKFMSPGAYQSSWGTLNIVWQALSGTGPIYPINLSALNDLNKSNYQNHVYVMRSQAQHLGEIYNE